MTVEIVELTAGHCEALVQFFSELPDGDRTFIKEDVTDPAVVSSWTGADAGGRRAFENRARAQDIRSPGPLGRDLLAHLHQLLLDGVPLFGPQVVLRLQLRRIPPI